MTYEIVFDESTAEDFGNILLHETQVLCSVKAAEKRLDELVDAIVEGLEYFPERHAERSVGITEAPRRMHPIGKYAAFYWIDEKAGVVHIDKIMHAKANFDLVHFGN